MLLQVVLTQPRVSIAAGRYLLETNYTKELLEEFIAAGSVSTVITQSAMLASLPDSVLANKESLILLDGADWSKALLATGTLPEYTAQAVGPESVAYLTMTSGSTGKPKAVVNTHLGATVCFWGRFEMFPYAAGEREGLNVFYAWECLRANLKGETCVVIPDRLIFDPPQLLEFIHKQRITRLMVTPSLLASILEFPDVDHRHLMEHMRWWILEGEVVTMNVVNKFKQAAGDLGVRLMNAFSSWESLDIGYADLTNPDFAASNSISKFAPCGSAMPECQVYILDDNLNFCKVEQPGNVWVSGPMLFNGYLNDPVKTADKLKPNPYAGYQADPRLGGPTYKHAAQMYVTGDRGRIRADRQLEVMGRADSTVKIRAFKVSLMMVETTINEFDEVAIAAVNPVLNAETKQPEHLVAYIQAKGDTPADKEFVLAVHDKLKEKLPDYAVPGYWVPMKEMPYKKGESRKLDRKGLAPPTEKHRISPSGSANADGGKAETPESLGKANKMASVLTDAFMTALSIDSIAATDNFFEVGGHSLLAAKLVGELSSLGKSQSPPLWIVSKKLLAGLAQHPALSLWCPVCAVADAF